MQKLVTGIHQFQQGYFSRHRQLFETLSDGQEPLALFIACSDSRINPNLLTQTGPGELFILRNAGNIVPPHGATSGGEGATIEYAVSVLHVKDIIVCGHSKCGAIASLLDPESTRSLPEVSSWLRYAEATRRIISENYAHLEDPGQRLMAAVQENVLVQIEHLRTHPSVAAALGRNDIRLHGWVYKFESGEVFSYHPENGQFLTLDSPSAPPRRHQLAATQAI